MKCITVASVLMYLVFPSCAYSVAHLRLLGSKCTNDQECLADVTYSRCQAERCSCLPYYAEYNKTMCVQSTLLGFDCLVKEQCSMKVANSMCLHGSCRCESGYLQFRRHTCLSPASPGDVCYSDAHCRLWDSDTHCDFLIPNLFGRCQCNHPMKQRGKSCYQFNGPTGEGYPSATGPSSMDSPNTSSFASSGWGSSSSAVWQPVSPSSSTSTPSPTELIVTSQNISQTFSSIPSSYTSTSSTQSNVPIKDSSLSTSGTFLDEAQPTLASVLPSQTEYTPEETHTETPSSAVSSIEDLNQSSQFVQQTQTANPEISTTDSLPQSSALFTETSYEPTVSVATTSQHTQTQFHTSARVPSGQPTVVTTSRDDFNDSLTEVTSQLPIATSTVVWTRIRGVGEGVAVTLGLPCVSDLQCQSADPGSTCLKGICDCAIKNNGSHSCGARNSGCYKGTFQCRSTGVCISWFFVCDGRQDCPDGSDEECKDSKSCPPQAFRCGQKGGCVSRAGRCDGTPDCPDGEDELHCNVTRGAKGCPDRTFRCSDGRCLPEYEFCNAMVTCRDGSDEPRDACKARTKRKTPGYCPFRCANGRCRSDAIACSGRDGCGDGSDEAKCSVCRCPMAPPEDGRVITDQ